MMKTRSWLAVPVAILMATAATAAEPVFYTLGTGSGPMPEEKRAQPANLLIDGDQAVMIDVGDGATQQLGKIGIPIERIQTVFISHLHFDHTGGLFALISRRFQLLVPGKLTIYGPPGTKATVDGLVAAMLPAVTAQSNISARAPVPPADTVQVVEIGNGWKGSFGRIAVTAASNTHYVLQPDGPGSSRNDTYALRFDMPGRSIVYTGDTGPSAAIEKLATGADMLVSELMDPDESLAGLKARRPDIPPKSLMAVEAHFRNQHLPPAEAGLMASRAGVKELVITHNAVSDGGLDKARAAIAAHFKGSITFAKDLEKFR